MWNVLKFTYVFPEESRIRTKIHPYLHLEEAENLFDHLSLAHQLDVPLLVKDGKRIWISSASLYTSFQENPSKAVDEITNGGGRLIREAHGIDVDLSGSY